MEIRDLIRSDATAQGPWLSKSRISTDSASNLYVFISELFYLCLFRGLFNVTHSEGECGVPYERRFAMPRPGIDQPW